MTTLLYGVTLGRCVFNSMDPFATVILADPLLYLRDNIQNRYSKEIYAGSVCGLICIVLTDEPRAVNRDLYIKP